MSPHGLTLRLSPQLYNLSQNELSNHCVPGSTYTPAVQSHNSHGIYIYQTFPLWQTES